MIISDSTKQKVNSRSSTEAELIGVEDKISKILWARRSIKYQGFKVKLNIIYQDNTSTMKLENNGKASSGKRTRHFDIEYFYVTDLIGGDEVEVIYCPTGDILHDKSAHWEQVPLLPRSCNESLRKGSSNWSAGVCWT
jgi:hypothetical protein